MTADPALVTARISGGGDPSAGHSPWAGIFDRLQTATLGEFQVIRELGRGGMAAVYLAHDIHLDRKVAIKVMSPLLANDERMVERFRREAKTGAGLKHPNIGTVHRVLEGEGLYFFVMDFIRGRPLDAIIHRNGVLAVPVTRALLHQIGSGLAYAHRRKIYHRDVKPANVLISAADGTAVVTDFGIAKVAESPNQTQTGAVVGTPAYMAPEQIFGREITGAVDQYALGVMAYEMLTGAPPFVGTSFVVMHAHTEVQPRPIRESRPDCPQELDDAIMRMLAKDPNHRWPSLPHALAAMGATMIGEDDPIRDELIRLATPNEAETARFATNTPLSPPPPTAGRTANVAMVAISLPPDLIEPGDTFRLAASARDMNGTEVPGVPITWATNNDQVLDVQSDGSVSARSPGTAEISATAGRARGAMLLTVEPGRVSTVQMTIPPGVVMAGDRVQLAARVLDKHQRPLAYAVKWSVADPNIARVSPEGVLEARAAGSVEVFAESNGVRSAGRVQIAPPAVASVQLSFDPQRPVVGDRIRVTATPLDAHGQAIRDRAIGWSLSDLSLITIVGDGLFEAVKPGTLRVTAASEGKSATIDIAIAPAPVAAVRVTHAPHLVVAGTVFTVAGAAVDAKGNVLPSRRIEWACSDTSHATVSADGTVTTHSAGDVRITATCEGKTASVAVTIKPAPVGAVQITGVPQAVYVKAPFRLAVTVSDTRGRQLQKTAEWRSSNVAVLTINQAGQATGLSVGHARITATVDGVDGVVDITVAEPAIPKVVVVPTHTPAHTPTPQPADVSAILSPRPALPPSPAVATPVVAPASNGMRRLFIGTGAAAVALAGVLVVTMLQSKPEELSPADSALLVTPAKDTTAPTPPAVAPPAQTPDTVAAKPDSAKDAKTLATPPRPARDVFRVSIAPQSPLRVGDGAMLRASVQRTVGTGALPRVTWESNRPTVLRVDASTGMITALSEGQATVTAAAGTARAETQVLVQPAPAPVVTAPYTPPQQQVPPVTRANNPPADSTPSRPTVSANDVRARGEAALRSAANNMAAALSAKNAVTAGVLFGDGQNADAVALLNGVKDYSKVTATIAKMDPPKMGERGGSMEYQIDFRYENSMGIERRRTLTMRAEIERRADGWTASRQTLVSGWR
jgi:serine/threonine protein kinase/uncharacterized protein YjdB